MTARGLAVRANRVIGAFFQRASKSNALGGDRVALPRRRDRYDRFIFACRYESVNDRVRAMIAICGPRVEQYMRNGIRKRVAPI